MNVELRNMNHSLNGINNFLLSKWSKTLDILGVSIGRQNLMFKLKCLDVFIFTSYFSIVNFL